VNLFPAIAAQVALWQDHSGKEIIMKIPDPIQI
jgi:hypothetical protein